MFYIDESTKKELFNTFYKKSRELYQKPRLDDVGSYLFPYYRHEFVSKSSRVLFYAKMLLSPENMKREIEEIYDRVELSKKVKSFLDEGVEAADKALQEPSVRKKDILQISVRLESKNGSFDKEHIADIPKDQRIRNLCEIMDVPRSELLESKICSRLFFAKNYGLVGDLLPKPLPLPKDIESKVGQTSMNGFNLRFEESPIGLEEVIILMEEERWIVQVKTRISTEEPSDIFSKGPDFAISISKMFLESLSE